MVLLPAMGSWYGVDCGSCYAGCCVDSIPWAERTRLLMSLLVLSMLLAPSRRVDIFKFYTCVAGEVGREG